MTKMQSQKSKIFFSAILFFALFGWARISRAADHYVSPTGAARWEDCGAPAKNGTAACSPETAMANAVAGDTVYFMSGIYNVGARQNNYEHSALEPANSGTAGNPVVFKSYVPLEAVIVADNASGTCDPYEANAIGSYDKDYIVIDGFKIQGKDAVVGTPVPAKVQIRSANHCEIKNCEIIGVNNWGSPHSCNIEAVRVEDSDSTLVRNNDIHDYRHLAEDHNYSCYKSYNASNAIIENNTFSNCTVGVYDKEQATNNDYRYNFFRDNQSAWFCQSAIYQSSGHHIYQNIIINTALKGIAHDDIGEINMTGISVYNNTLYNADSESIEFTDNGWSIFNNVVANATDIAIRAKGENGDPEYCDYNIYSPGQLYQWNGLNYNYAQWTNTDLVFAGGYPDAHSFVENPQFANAGGSSPEDYKINALHKNNGRGGSYASVIGAYITGDEVIGYTSPGAIASSDITPPAAPQGLSVN